MTGTMFVVQKCEYRDVEGLMSMLGGGSAAGICTGHRLLRAVFGRRWRKGQRSGLVTRR
jgi:hypothetical protein